MRIGNAVAWGGGTKVPLAQGYGGTCKETRVVAAGGMPYEDESAQHKAHYNCLALKKNGEYCGSWTTNEGTYCQGHLMALAKLDRKIAECEDEAERLLLEEERVRKWR